jgi:hypothetical protein
MSDVIPGYQHQPPSPNIRDQYPLSMGLLDLISSVHPAGAAVHMASDYGKTGQTPSAVDIGIGLLGAPSKAAKLAGGLLAGLYPSEAEAKWFTSIQKPNWEKNGGIVDIFVNPTKSELGKLVKSSGPQRAAKDFSNGDVYVWPSDAALHNEVIRALPQGRMIDSAGTVFDWKDYLALLNP